MEMTGISEAAQALEVSIKGFDTVARLTGNFTSWTMENVIRLVKFIMYTIEKQKNNPQLPKKGEVSLDKLFQYSSKNNEDTMIMQIDEAQMNDFFEYAKSNNLTYSMVEDGNLSDNKKEIAYISSQMAAYAVYINSRSPKASAYSWNEFEANITPERAMQVEQALGDEVKTNIRRAFG